MNFILNWFGPKKAHSTTRCEKYNKKNYYNINGSEYIFDAIGLEEFLSNFNKPPYEIMICEGYLARKNILHPESKPEYFHRWFKMKRTNRKETEYSHIHHKNGNINDNRLKNLVFETPENHYELHIKRKAHKTFCEKFLAEHPEQYKWMSLEWKKFWNKVKDKELMPKH